MAKRRTKKDKEKAKHSFEVKWELGTGTLKFEPNVNRQLKTVPDKPKNISAGAKLSDISAEASNTRTIKKDLSKSLMLAGLILGIELVIYLFWNQS